ncbi:GAF domain-containing protein [Actinomadura bangladeshensis]|uniref:GAF domain-containing protein n=1 Tax=Actinomadura bangladeshensis TaxID=453573 RepID=A0A4R4NHT5_9ACTN|nr:GAF domain-containing protein [Actinomadura bangladeshensis]TDC07170.1 GAF domain-containing protein [Actinomadura bangladeshensis]
MKYDANGGLHVSTWRDGAEQRLEVLAALGLEGAPDAEFDQFAAQISSAFAAELGEHGQGLYSMVNLFTEEEQTFVGLHVPPGMRAVDRTMRPDHGFCPEMLDRTKALILADVCANPHFASNPVVDKLGVRTYAGAPLVHEAAGTVLGTVCVIGTEPLPKDTGHTSLALIKRHRDALMNVLARRADRVGVRESDDGALDTDLRQ